jgi:hypothetical protein
MICIFLLILICFATYLNNKINTSEKTYMWISLAILGISTFIYQNKSIENFENNKQYNQVIMSEPYTEADSERTIYKLLNDTVVEGNLEDNGKTIYWDFENKSWLDLNLDAFENSITYIVDSNGILTNTIDTINTNNVNSNSNNNTNNVNSNSNNNSNNVNSNTNNNVNNGNGNNVNNNVNNVNSNSNNNVNNNVNNGNGNNVNNNVNNGNGNNVNNNNGNKGYHKLDNKINSLINNVGDIEQTMLNNKHKRELRDVKNKVTQSPHIPNVAQYGTKGVSNIFTPHIILRKKSPGKMSYNSARDTMEQNSFPDIDFVTGNKGGKIITNFENKNKDWQKPTHNLWKSEMNNIPVDEILDGKNNDTTMYEGPYYWDSKLNKITSNNKSGKEIYWDMDNSEWLDNNYNPINIPNGMLPDDDPLDNVKENMNAVRRFKINGKKDCNAYITSNQNDDEEKLVQEAVEKGTWKQFDPDYVMVDPKKWNVPHKRPPVCLPDRVKLPSAVFTDGTPVNVLEFNRYGNIAHTEEDVSRTNVGSILPKFKFKQLNN